MQLSRLLAEARKISMVENSQQVINRIENIPGWEDLNFLVSLRQQMRAGRTASPKQLDVLDAIEKKAQSRGQPRQQAPAPPDAVQVQLPRQGDYRAILQPIRKALINGKKAAVEDLSGTIAQRGGAAKFQGIVQRDVQEFLYDWFVRPDEDEADYRDGYESEQEMIADWAAEPSYEYMEAHLNVQAKEIGRGVLVWADPPVDALIKKAQAEGDKIARARLAKAGKLGRQSSRA